MLPNDPLADLRLLTIIAGDRSWKDGDSDKTDICNNYALYSLIATCVFFGVILLSFCACFCVPYETIKGTLCCLCND